MTSATMTIRLEEQVKLRLDKLADITHRSRSFLAVEAINEYLKIQEWQLAEIREGIAEANLGQVVSHEDVLKEWEKKGANPVDKGC